MQTKLPAFQDALHSVLAAGVTLAPVSLGWPHGGLASKQVWIAGKADMDVISAVSGYGSRDEELKAEVRIWVELKTTDYSEIRDAAFALLDQVDDAIEADLTLGGVVQRAQVTGYRLEDGAEGANRYLGIVLTVTADATVQ